MTHAATKATANALDMRSAHPAEDDDDLLCLFLQTREKRRSSATPLRNASVASSDIFHRRPSAGTKEGQGECEDPLLDIMRQKRLLFQVMQGESAFDRQGHPNEPLARRRGGVSFRDRDRG
eukprot:CAMPEP_0180245998 /NCGR_PEP_ID=MMETSP0987-20121128/35310_1 /TAXON_ID=697907 /ORGANISM="non described non described, Strain CCMP2293" /LENGTH=120 /DNA_ID=CAMNT_0022213725 /DNA_START=37 /DNA_END=396 /DNA_ORIENTATION=-